MPYPYPSPFFQVGYSCALYENSTPWTLEELSLRVCENFLVKSRPLLLPNFTLGPEAGWPSPPWSPLLYEDNSHICEIPPIVKKVMESDLSESKAHSYLYLSGFQTLA